MVSSAGRVGSASNVLVATWSYCRGVDMWKVGVNNWIDQQWRRNQCSRLVYLPRVWFGSTG